MLIATSADLARDQTVIARAEGPCSCWVTVWLSRKRRSNGWFSKIAVVPAAFLSHFGTAGVWMIGADTDLTFA
jgi:hypothetical protein